MLIYYFPISESFILSDVYPIFWKICFEHLYFYPLFDKMYPLVVGCTIYQDHTENYGFLVFKNTF